MTIYEADWICPAASPPIRNAAIAVRNGMIVQVAEAAPLRTEPGESIEQVRFPGCAIIPGFVNAHAHLELTCLRGFLENIDFVSWIRKLITTKYEKLSPEELRQSARLGVIELLMAGVTCVGEVMDLGTSWEAMREFGLQGIAYQEVFGPDERQAEAALQGLHDKVSAIHAQQTLTCRVGVSPHAPYSVSPRLFRMVGDYAASQKLPMTIHIAESIEEERYVQYGDGPFAERNRARGFVVEAAGCSGITYLGRLGILGPDTLLIHAIRAKDADFEILRRTQTPVVHCPKSNAKLAHGIAPIAEMRRYGVTLGLGTDSVASNNVVDMFEEMRSAIFMQRAVTGRVDSLDAYTAFRMATLGGAECLGLSSHLGSLEAGKRADFAVIDLSGNALQPVYDPIETMAYSACRRDVQATYIGGTRIDLYERQ